MEQNHDHENLSERYLLGELSEPEQMQFEESYFADDTLFERFLAVKDELIDAYARGDLTGQKRERFEQHFLTTEPRRRHVDEANDLIRATTATSLNSSSSKTAGFAGSSAASWRQFIFSTFTRRPLVWQGALAALLVIAAAASWVIVRRFRDQRAERQRIQIEEAIRRQQEEQRRQAPAAPGNENRSENGNQAANANTEEPHPKIPNNNQSPGPPAGFASLVLLPFNARDVGSADTLALRPDTASVHLKLVFKGDTYRRYDVVLLTVGGEQVLHRSALKATTNGAGTSVALTFSSSLLRHQDYIAKLNGVTTNGQIEAINDYYFRVDRSASHSTPNKKP